MRITDEAHTLRELVLISNAVMLELLRASKMAELEQ